MNLRRLRLILAAVVMLVLSIGCTSSQSAGTLLASADNWDVFDYVETGRTVIESPSPEGLEYYTQYITGGGVIIVGGPNIPIEALYSTHDAYEYMTSARPEFRDILRDSHARVSLFWGPDGDSSQLPEFIDHGEEGGFAMMVGDAAATANAAWSCFDGGVGDGRGSPIIHELLHTIEHLVFEAMDDEVFLENIHELSLLSKDSPELAWLVERGDDYFGEFWAVTGTDYILDLPTEFRSDTTDQDNYFGRESYREFLINNNQELYEFLTRYFPATPPPESIRNCGSR
jgi:hypothetical protein